MKKRFVSLGLGLLLTASLLVGCEEKVLEYILGDDGTYTAYVYDDTKEVDIVIPSTYQGKPVTKVGDHAMDTNTRIQSVVMEDGIEVIGDYAFELCTSLKSVTFPQTLTSIGFVAFEHSTIGDLELPDSVVSIGSRAFYGCYGITTVKIGQNLSSIGASAFDLCRFLTSFEVSPNNQTFESIDGNLYQKDGTLLQYAIGKPNTFFAVPDGTKTIASHAFATSENLKTVLIPKSVTKVEPDPFAVAMEMKAVYYEGTQEEWEKIKETTEKGDVTSVPVYYYAETMPSTTGNYWHYVDGNPVKWE